MTGPQGVTGSQGVTGPQGLQGSGPGNIGPQGNNGFKGQQGNPGNNGPQGSKGYKGPQGDTGNNGSNGSNGAQGAQGDQGPQGYIGLAGNIYISNDTTVAGVNAGTTSYNTIYGSQGLKDNINATQNVAIGTFAMQNGRYGDNNTAIGWSAMFMANYEENTVGCADNVSIGYRSLYYNRNGSRNIAIGKDTMSLNTNGLDNVAIGNQSLLGSTEGRENVSIGNNTLTISSNYNNTVIGNNALRSTTGSGHTAVGYNALNQNTSTLYSTAVGFEALKSDKSAYNTAVGYQAASKIDMNSTQLGSNTAIGYEALLDGLTVFNNVAIGARALATATSPTGCVAVGFESCYNVFADNSEFCTAIGSYSGQPESGTTTTKVKRTNATALGYGARFYSDNSITLGNNSIGNANLYCAVTSISVPSDKRDKTDIEQMDSTLNFISSLKPVTYKWDKRELYPNGIPDGSKKEDTVYAGFLAQDLKESQEQYNLPFLNLASTYDNGDHYTATYGNLITPLVKCTEELISIIKTQKQEINALKTFIFNRNLSNQI
jgi:hypothetical protein